MAVTPLLMVLVALVLAFLVSELFRRLGLPRAVGQIGAGLILGTAAVKGVIFGEENLSVLGFLAKLGLILLFYYVGLEVNLRGFRKNLKEYALISALNTALPFALGFALMRYGFGQPLLPSLIVGAAVSVSAQAVAMDLLEELKLLKSRLGGLLVSAGAVDDVIELVLMTAMFSVFHVAGGQSGLGVLLVEFAVFVALVLVSRFVVIPRLFKVYGSEHSSTALFTESMIVVLLIATLSEFLGVGALIGAMVAGLIVRQTIFKDLEIPDWEEHDISRSIHIIAFGFLIPMFFVWVGVSTDLGLAASHLGLIALLVVVATVGTIGGTVLALRLNGLSAREGFVLGWGLNAKGDLELVIAIVALDAGLISAEIFTALVVMSLATSIISPVVFKRLALRHVRRAHAAAQ